MTRLVAGEWKVQPEALIGFLSSKRWFGDKGRVIRSATITDVIPVRWIGVDKEYAVARARVTTDAGTSSYQLFLVQGEKLTDALDDAEFRRGLADAFVKGATFENAGTRWIVESQSATPLVVPAAADITLSTAEQTNSSVIIDREAILKLYRKLERGVHPDVEVTRFLTIERRFVHVPVLLGTIRFEDADGVTTAGMLQEYVTGAVDGWTYALEISKKLLSASDEDAELPFQNEAEQLGIVTRAMHETLASGDSGSDFEYQRASRDSVRRWVDNATRTIEATLTALDQSLRKKGISDDHIAEARSIVGRGDYAKRLSELVSAVGADAGANTRTHGDYHLGQVLRSAAGQFLVIDFEGEPTRPLGERRARHSPLRDVAGMLRSFTYAAAVAERRKPDQRRERWERATREAFLRGYFAKADGRDDLLPRSRSNADRLITLFETEKVFYELQYELDHRPDWVWIPLRGIAKLRA